MLPYSLGGAGFSAISGILLSRIKSYRFIMWFAWVVMVLGWGLMTQLDDRSTTFVVLLYFAQRLADLMSPNRPEKVLYPLVTSVGIGCLFQVCR